MRRLFRPVRQMVLAFNACLQSAGQFCIKIISREAFHLVDGASSLLQGLVVGRISEDEGNSFLFSVPKVDNRFEKGVGDAHALLQPSRLFPVEEGACHHVERVALFGRPCTASLFEHSPVAAVERVFLRTDVGEQERFNHGRQAPFVVAGRTKVTAVVARAAVVAQKRFRVVGQFRIFVKARSAFGVALQPLRRQRPGHVVGLSVAGVVRGAVAFALQFDFAFNGGCHERMAKQVGRQRIGRLRFTPGRRLHRRL